MTCELAETCLVMWEVYLTIEKFLILHSLFFLGIPFSTLYWPAILLVLRVSNNKGSVSIPLKWNLSSDEIHSRRYVLDSCCLLPQSLLRNHSDRQQN